MAQSVRQVLWKIKHRNISLSGTLSSATWPVLHHILTARCGFRLIDSHLNILMTFDNCPLMLYYAVLNKKFSSRYYLLKIYKLEYGKHVTYLHDMVRKSSNMYLLNMYPLISALSCWLSLGNTSSSAGETTWPCSCLETCYWVEHDQVLLCAQSMVMGG